MFRVSLPRWRGRAGGNQAGRVPDVPGQSTQLDFEPVAASVLVPFFPFLMSGKMAIGRIASLFAR